MSCTFISSVLCNDMLVVGHACVCLQCDDGTACLYDARFSPDGTRFTTVDSQGCLSFFGFGKDYHYKKVLHNT